MEVLQKHLVTELEARRRDTDALARGQGLDFGELRNMAQAWATGGSVGAGGAATSGLPPPGPGEPVPLPPAGDSRESSMQGPARTGRKLKESTGGGSGGGEKRDLTNPELGWVRRLVSFVDSSPIYVPQDGASNVTFTEGRQWEQTVFPSLRPDRREDVQMLERWLEAGASTRSRYSST